MFEHASPSYRCRDPRDAGLTCFCSLNSLKVRRTRRREPQRRRLFGEVW